MTPAYMLPVRRPAGAMHALARALRRRGVVNLYGASCDRYGVLSLPRVSVWTNGQLLWWRAGGDETTWFAAGAPGAAQRLAALGDD